MTTTTIATAAALRASDADREHAAGVIHAAAGAGMLTLDEAAERLGTVYASRFRDELTGLIADLPVGAPVFGSGKPGLLGWLSVTVLSLLTLTAPLRALARRHRVVTALLVVTAVVALGAAIGLLGDGGEHDEHEFLRH